ncbi:-bisphosphate nucleotidase 1 [Stylonychia lemnae]|uniref:-bisphosphate nucleotidase 1 n=1 Tax=Stylonychia lemnae TaxID=5949 RepID=A0A078AMM0_STYLE|nr:-bisphosphate nucleotidase 1 [Stylonychia lemnae]|eukprot:CDW83399.1 -bisphosphate nucleotidase 1 [Stylonychia lemnae]
MESQISHQDIKVAEFISVCIYLAEESGKIIRDVWKSGVLGKQEKSDDNGPVTIADLRVQKNINENLHKLYPTLAIEGEEDQSTYEKYEASIKPEDIPLDFVKQDQLDQTHANRISYLETLKDIYGSETNSFPFNSFNTEKAVVWIDPLDGTSDFVKGNLSAVTVLIGLSIDGISKIGIVHHPFSLENSELGKTTIGSLEHGCFQMFYDEKQTREQHIQRTLSPIIPFPSDEQPAEDHKLKVATSISHFSNQIKESLDLCQPLEVSRIGGAGNKCCSVALGLVDSYIYPQFGLKYWDLCASESIIKGMGGHSTNILLERLSYHRTGDKQIKGLIIAKNPNYHRLIVNRFQTTFFQNVRKLF